MKAYFLKITMVAENISLISAKSMEIQNALGADIIMAFDDCVKNPATHEQAKAAMERTHKWLEALYRSPYRSR